MDRERFQGKGLTFDDVVLVPQYSEVKSRADVDISTVLFGQKFELPIISANMESITELAMAKAMFKAGGFGILHRFTDDFTQFCWIDELSGDKVFTVPSIGGGESEVAKAFEFLQAGADAICIDIAHGHSRMMFQTVKMLKKNKLQLIAGNVATYEGALALASEGV